MSKRKPKCRHIPCDVSTLSLHCNCFSQLFYNHFQLTDHRDKCLYIVQIISFNVNNMPKWEQIRANQIAHNRINMNFNGHTDEKHNCMIKKIQTWNVPLCNRSCANSFFEQRWRQCNIQLISCWSRNSEK